MRTIYSATSTVEKISGRHKRAGRTEQCGKSQSVAGPPSEDKEVVSHKSEKYTSISSLSPFPSTFLRPRRNPRVDPGPPADYPRRGCRHSAKRRTAVTNDRRRRARFALPREQTAKMNLLPSFLPSFPPSLLSSFLSSHFTLRTFQLSRT